MGMALDEPKEDDQVFTEKGVTFLVEKKLFDEAKPITVDYITTDRGEGFKITSALTGGANCGSTCGGSC